MKSQNKIKAQPGKCAPHLHDAAFHRLAVAGFWGVEMKKITAIVSRNGIISLRLVGAEVREDGTIWYKGNPLLDGQAPGALPKDQAIAAIKDQRWQDIPPAQYARLGLSASGLLVRDAAEVAAESRKAYDVSHPGAAERRIISDMFARANARRDADDDCNTMDYYSIRAQAQAKLKLWREKYPAEAREEEANSLRAKADRARDLARCALFYDCDGLFSPADQENRSNEFLAEAKKLETEATEMMKK